MRLSAEQFTAIGQEAGHGCATQAEPWLSGSRAQRGFTLTELITILVIAGILAVAAIPRFFDRNTFDSRGFYDQVISSLRYAQKTAIAQHRNVCVIFTLGPPSTVTLRIASLSGAVSACDTNLISPAGDPTYVITAPAGVAFTALPTDFSFNALGRPNPNATQGFAINGAAFGIVIEAETGYVY